MTKIKLIFIIAILVFVNCFLSASQFDFQKNNNFSFIQKPISFINNIKKSKCDNIFNQKKASLYIGRLDEFQSREADSEDSPLTRRYLICGSIYLAVGLTLFFSGVAGMIVGAFLEQLTMIIFLSTFGGACLAPGLFMAPCSSFSFYKVWKIKNRRR